eukprot:CAMPEP_0203932068 /NCGR_PEP_ID=MMETSP0359-20131031/70526_1 /ASSEMBLY_ACC=CAM_ASM_000338 /TAXON_ID=268821 /ORGANISM="Scrippsiella Hangoei, Strain SHTV-5" /LENGTH=70 /DNA_ID=CAMNT_0050861471 /DNA_START=266 /DNA_END=474 /DNA_ORIENTATION=+
MKWQSGALRCGDNHEMPAPIFFAFDPEGRSHVRDLNGFSKAACVSNAELILFFQWPMRVRARPWYPSRTT